MDIHQARASDAVRIAPLFQMYRQFYNQKDGKIDTIEWFLHERLKKNESTVFYASEADSVIGFVQLYPSFSSISLKRLWVLNDLFVKPEARRRSVARHLLIEATKFARETKARGLTLKTAIDNNSARLLYESMGWKRDDRYESFNYIIETS